MIHTPGQRQGNFPNWPPGIPRTPPDAFEGDLWAWEAWVMYRIPVEMSMANRGPVAPPSPAEEEARQRKHDRAFWPKREGERFNSFQFAVVGGLISVAVMLIFVSATHNHFGGHVLLAVIIGTFLFEGVFLAVFRRYPKAAIVGLMVGYTYQAYKHHQRNEREANQQAFFDREATAHQQTGSTDYSGSTPL